MTIEVTMKPIVMPAGEFKAKCLAVMDQVQSRRTPVTITKNGKPVARLVPVPFEGEDPIFGFFAGKARIVGDITAPIYTDEEWEEFFEAKAAKFDAPVREFAR
jgi:prevent-host-death family protein